MVVTLFPETAYTFRRTAAVMPAVGAVAASSGDIAALICIENLLVTAGRSFRSRRYLDAVDEYTEARKLMYGQLFPTSRYVEVAARKLELFSTLASYAGEWLNVLPVETAPAGVRPRQIPDIDPGPNFGLRTEDFEAEVTRAAADLEVAKTLTRRGNPQSARFFRKRAEAAAPEFVRAANVLGAAPMAVRLNDGGLAEEGRDRAVALREIDIPAALTAEKRSYSWPVADRVERIEWAVGEAPAVDKMISMLYEARKGFLSLPDVLIKPERPADVAAGLPHAWYYETTLGLAECHHAMGNWSEAEGWYLDAARYKYLNSTVEAPYVWARLATLYLDWGNSLFRSDDAPAALQVFVKVVGGDGSVPASDLYTIAGLQPAADIAQAAIANLAGPPVGTVRPEIVSVVYDVWAQLSKIAGGLDFWGHWAANVPIWTFDYLQSVAANFCQLAIGAERDAVSFWEKADQGQLTRTQLVENLSQAGAERDAAISQVAAAGEQVKAYQAGEAAATQRAESAQANADDYTQKSKQWIIHQAQSAQLGAGDDANAAQLNRLADRMMSGSYNISDDRGALVGAEQLVASRKQREYEIDSMKRQVKDLQAAADQAKAERIAAEFRATAAQASADAAVVRVTGASQLVLAFDQQRFTPDVWNALGQKMTSHSQRYLAMALDVAKLMQRAYNFENDTIRSMIKADYVADSVKGLLAADALMVDVQSFTYDMVTSTAPKPQPVRQTISLATGYPFLFERDFRRTGRMQFETRIDDFDVVYPGTYGGRIEYVEVDVDGIVPATGISGTLTNAGISHYRVPSAAWPVGGSPLKHRVQSRETLVISDHDPRIDAILVDNDRRRRRVFEGAGVASSWTLELSKAVNDLDYDAILDVRLTVTYEARYDPDLRQRVLDDLATLPALHERQRPVPLRWLFPDAFFSFYETGVLAFELTPGWFPRSEVNPVVIDLGLFLVASPQTRADGIVLRFEPPGRAPVTITTAADGTVDTADLSTATGGAATGPFRIELAAADNPMWVTDGKLELDAIDNLSLILSYSFTPRT